MNVEHLARAIPVLVPHPVEDLFAADHTAGLKREARQDVELAPGERDLVAAHERPLAGNVHRQVADLYQFLGIARPAQHGAHPREQLVEPERLDQVVVCSCVERFDACGHGAARGDDDDA